FAFVERSQAVLSTYRLSISTPIRAQFLIMFNAFTCTKMCAKPMVLVKFPLSQINQLLVAIGTQTLIVAFYLIYTIKHGLTNNNTGFFYASPLFGLICSISLLVISFIGTRNPRPKPLRILQALLIFYAVLFFAHCVMYVIQSIESQEMLHATGFIVALSSMALLGLSVTLTNFVLRSIDQEKADVGAGTSPATARASSAPVPSQPGDDGSPYPQMTRNPVPLP
ncbi:hypothetical protein PFISCL1PPCAC_23221, partial [Pristionchus fissidentatus]